MQAKIAEYQRYQDRLRNEKPGNYHPGVPEYYKCPNIHSLRKLQQVDMPAYRDLNY